VALSSLIHFSSSIYPAIHIIIISTLRLLTLALCDFLVSEAVFAVIRDPQTNPPDSDDIPPTMSPSWLYEMTLYFLARIGIKVILSVPICALEVLVVRTATTHLSGPTPTRTTEPTGQPKSVANPEEDPVTRLRHPGHSSPFKTLVAIWTEEGPHTLLRGWWVSLAIMVIDVYPVGFFWAVWTD